MNVNRSPRMLLAAAVLLGLASSPAAALTSAAPAPADCPTVVNPRVEEGWVHYRAGDIAAAETAFAAALARCPEHPDALTGAGFAALRQGDLPRSKARFTAALAQSPELVDALVGLGLIAWRRGDLQEVHDRFTAVQRLDPARPEAREYLARLPEEVGPPPTRSPLVRPETVTYPARTAGSRFEVRTASGWEPFYIKGINLGAALPGRNPSEFPDSATYETWVAQIGEMGANTIRLYTIHPPRFYRAIERHNLRHPDRPLWLMHGVWTELPPRHDYEDPEWEGEFFAEMHRVVDVVHGRADIAARPGHAFGFYTADVSRWVLGYIIGREWEPYSVAGFDRLNPGPRSWEGRYLSMRNGTASEAWMTKAVEEIVAYEMERYNAQRPVAYTNWPTLDPMSHPTELAEAAEMAIRGIPVDEDVERHDEDAVSLGQTPVRATAHFPAGYFAAFHVYPYYPDFMVLDPEYGRASSPYGPSNFYGYLQDLKRHFHDVPLVIAEYGVPTSLGNAHLQPQGWHHGGHTEAAMAEINSRMTREIAAAGMAGGIVFAWIDEWFKKNWLVMDFAIPLERNRLWLNRLDAEQAYGMIAMEPAEILAGATLEERLTAWRQRPALYDTADGVRLRAAADEAHLWLLVEGGTAASVADLMIGFDLTDREVGSFRWPAGRGERLPVGIDFALVHDSTGARLLVEPGYNPFRLNEVPRGATAREFARPMEGVPPGFFTGRLSTSYNRPLLPRRSEEGAFEPLRLVVNVPRVGSDSTDFAGMGYDRGILREGPAPDGNWEVHGGANVFEARIPWALLNVSDPSQRRILKDREATGEIGTAVVDGIRLLLGIRGEAGEWRSLPQGGGAGDVALFAWDTWEEPRWRPRTRPVYHTMRELFATMSPPVLQARVDN
jgi:hypothetical protein